MADVSYGIETSFISFSSLAVTRTHMLVLLTGRLKTAIRISI